MRNLLYILVLLLATTYSYGQRYRVVADSTYEYSSESSDSIVKAVNRYIYNEGNEWMTTDGKYFYYDTMYHYESNYNDSLQLIYKGARKYDKMGMVLNEMWYEQFVIGEKRQTVQRDSDSVMVSYIRNEYYKDEAYVLVRNDSFVYDVLGRLKARFFLATTSEVPSVIPNRYCKTYPTGEYKFYLRELTKYQYENGNCTTKYIYEYRPKGGLYDEMHVNYSYNKNRKKSADSIRHNGWLFDKNKIHYKKHRELSRFKRVYEEDDEGNMYSRQCVKHITKDGIYECRSWTKEKGERKSLDYTIVDSYDIDSFKRKSEYKEYYLNGNVLHYFVMIYQYTLYGYLKEKEVNYEHKENHYNDEIDSRSKSKTTYTYEEY